MKLNIIPIINANDAVAPPPEADLDLAGVGQRFVCYYDLFYERLCDQN